MEQCFEEPPADLTFPDDQLADTNLLADPSLYTPSLSPDGCLALLWAIFERLGLFDRLRIPREVFKRFLLTVRHNYRPNPYHNFYHAVDVTQCLYLFHEAIPVGTFEPMDWFAILVAAIGHDVCHPSFNNHFHIAHQTMTAALFSDRSPLEHLHSLVVCAIIRRHDFTLEWTREERLRFYSILRASILGTDMACHFDYLQQLQSRLPEMTTGNLGDGKLILTGLVKAADLCNVIRPFATARLWAMALISEFFHQGDWDQCLLGRVADPNFDRHSCSVPAGQVFFLERIALPLYQAIASVFPSLSFTIDELRRNVDSWSTVNLGDTSTL